MTLYIAPLAFCLLMSVTSVAQNVPPPDSVYANGKVFHKVEVEAAFPGGDHAWRNSLVKNLNATTPVDNGAPTGKYAVVVKFVVGQDGSSTPIDTIQARMKARPVSINIATYTGHATLRSKAMNDLARNATQKEIDSMRNMLSREMDMGSLGLATGLEYEAAFYSNRDEVVALSTVSIALMTLVHDRR